jgi:hypothetical protein
VITSSGNADVNAPSAIPPKVRPQAPELRVPERQSNPKGTHWLEVPTISTSVTITAK